MVPVMIAMIKILHQKSSYLRTILKKTHYRGKMGNLNKLCIKNRIDLCFDLKNIFI